MKGKEESKYGGRHLDDIESTCKKVGPDGVMDKRGKKE